MAYSIETRVVHGNRNYDSYTGAISFPIYQTATFRHPGPGESSGYDYSRSENPTREVVEKTLANLESGTSAYAFSSGMAAIATVLELFAPGDHLVVSDDLYGGTYRLFQEVSRRHGLSFSFVDSSVLNNVLTSIQTNTRAFFIETPSNPMMKISDLHAIIAAARNHRIKTIIDNTFLTPYYQRPLELGADIVVHSGTKFLGGHNDTLAGFVVVNDEKTGERIKFLQMSIGATLAPLDSWLIMRGLKTLSVRLERQQHNARLIAEWLQRHQQVEKVYYAGLPDHPGHNLIQKQSSGFGAMISFSVKDATLVERILKSVQLIAFAESLGGVESLITYPMTQTHAAVPKEIRDRLGVNERLLRLSVGIEEVEDIIADLEQAFNK
ncbi:MAG: PLP-dependent aspartate aminotransferase family protein [Syntrophomonadaceae bacterium]|jgi:cystathionine gamma-synthase|nr:PLP-dependent aspartate aminotransferase family protein [Syntrophomonadaceae bacterium]MDD3270984.1 PLP-dependent aspartate aminotransferase family protein [Syntrophomonadaceae bacterium]MDD3897395.1 PLP-dependent aspartate aminotransferase family protein [Syntrophomonadaceae bacterium]MDD4561670.1 PLP-dependent aspartate aminotransferase family protein [Syntrophomonadaceae bacterium]